MKFPTDVKAQILHTDIFSAVIELVKYSVRCHVLNIQSSFSRSFPVSISSALVLSLV